jgi:hypothetical protein
MKTPDTVRGPRKIYTPYVYGFNWSSNRCVRFSSNTWRRLSTRQKRECLAIAEKVYYDAYCARRNRFRLEIWFMLADSQNPYLHGN